MPRSARLAGASTMGSGTNHMRSAELRAGGHDAEFDLSLQPFLPDRVPALVVLADVAGAPLRRQVVRVVRRLVGHVGEERLAVAPVGVDVADQLVGVGLRGVVVLGQRRQVAPVLGEDRLRRRGGEVGHVPVAARAVEQREVALESARGGDLVRRLAQVPLADHVGVVAGIPEQLRQRGDAVVEVAFVPDGAPLVGRGPLVHVAQAVQVRVDAGQQRGSRGRAARVRVEVREAHAVLGQRVEVRGPDLAAERAHVGVPEVVAEDDDDVRPARRCPRRTSSRARQAPRRCRRRQARAAAVAACPASRRRLAAGAAARCPLPTPS